MTIAQYKINPGTLSPNSFDVVPDKKFYVVWINALLDTIALFVLE
jgi:hypothetical protein